VGGEMASIMVPAGTPKRKPRSIRRQGSGPIIVGMAAAALALEIGRAASGQTPQTLNGPPVQVQPYVTEPGVPPITINVGTLNPFAAVAGTGNDGGSGDYTSGAVDNNGSSGGVAFGGGGNVGGSEALNTLLATSAGAQIVAASQSLGVNPSVIAMTCVLESGCQNVGGSGAKGMFQMFPAAFTDGMQTALAVNPALASQIVKGDAGRMDPFTEAVAAAGYQLQAVRALHDVGIANPTGLDTRGYYFAGPTYGPQLARANGSQLMSDILPPNFINSNKIPAGMTVDQWRASVSSKVGSAASQSVLL
jgi:hypothetical protein